MNVSFDINRGLEKKSSRRFTQIIVLTVVILFGIAMMTKGCGEGKATIPVPVSRKDTLVVIVK